MENQIWGKEEIPATKKEKIQSIAGIIIVIAIIIIGLIIM